MRKDIKENSRSSCTFIGISPLAVSLSYCKIEDLSSVDFYKIPSNSIGYFWSAYCASSFAASSTSETAHSSLGEWI